MLSVIFPAVQEIVIPVPPKVPDIGDVIVLAPIVGAVLSRVMDVRVVPVFIPAILVAVNCACLTPLEIPAEAPAEKV